MFDSHEKKYGDLGCELANFFPPSPRASIISWSKGQGEVGIDCFSGPPKNTV